MDTNKIKSGLQDLIIRLQDAEKGYREINKATSNMALKSWLNRYADERHTMHRELEGFVRSFGGDAEVKTSILGDLHRIFIDFKLSAMDEDFIIIANEIERGASTLIEDYETVLKDIEMPSNIVSRLNSQKITIQTELSEIKKLKKDFVSETV